MFFYIDPGTGSMLFTILIGAAGALLYVFRSAWVKLKGVFAGGGRARGKEAGAPFVFFTDSKRYWTIFKPLCDEMERRGKGAGKACCTGRPPRTTRCSRSVMSM